MCCAQMSVWWCMVIVVGCCVAMPATTTLHHQSDRAMRCGLSAQPSSWTVRVSEAGHQNTEEAALCFGAAVSHSIVLTSARCVNASSPSSLYVDGRPVERILIHPDFDSVNPAGAHDLALLKLKKATTGLSFACLPDAGDDPINNCSAGRPSGNMTLGPSEACLDSAYLRGYLTHQSQIICAEDADQMAEHNYPIFCASAMNSRQFDLVGMPSALQSWQAAGAYTRIAHYANWILANVDDLENESPQPRQLHNQDIRNQGRQEQEFPCDSDPCGENAICWNSGSRFMCTCEPDHPKGNPYFGCSECLFDTHCNPDHNDGPIKCVEQVCIAPEPPDDGSSQLPPKDFLQVGSDYYYISQDELSWPQAQYECVSRKGFLVELNSGERLKMLLLLNILKQANDTSRYWIGASDFEQRGQFKWYYSGTEVSKDNWSADGRPPNNSSSKNSTTSEDSNDDRCLQVAVDKEGQWAVHSCELKSRYICAHVSSINDRSKYPALDRNGLVGGERSERQRQFDTLSPNAHYTTICGRRFVRPRTLSREGRIVGGGVADYAEWPWQVSLRQFKNGQFRHKCGAALLTHEWVVTAAHCIKDVSPSNLLVRIGEYNILDTKEAHSHIDRRITRVIGHSEFDKASYEYDIALLYMSEPVSFQPNVIPICLPDTDSDLVGEIGAVTGWGRKSEYGQISPVLREVHLPIISNAKCMSMYRMSGQNEWIPRIFLCAGTANGGQDSCEGDSGGPLVIKGQNGRFQLAGIISWGIGCGDRNRPGVYTRISEFKTWIVRNANYVMN